MKFKKDKQKSMVWHSIVKIQNNNGNNEAAKEKERWATKRQLDHKLTCQQQQWMQKKQ